MKVTIVGGGVVGLCTAYYLRRGGAEVTVLERDTITNGCSFGNMGYVSPSHFIPLATPGIIRQGLKWMMKSTSPFYIRPRLNMDVLNWGMRFWKSAHARNVELNAPHLNNLLQLSRSLMNELRDALPGSIDMVERGIWALYKNEATGDHEKQLAEQAAGYGLQTRICSAREVQEYEPDVEVDVAGGVLFTDDCHLHPAKFMQAMKNFLQQAGVKFWLNTPVTGFETGSGRITKVLTSQLALDADEVVIANGSWMGTLSKMLGIGILMQPGKGYSMLYEGLEKNLRYPSILVDHRTATAPIGNLLRIGGTMELSGHDERILPQRAAAIYHAFKKYYPSVKISAPETSRIWFGYRPVTPDGLPYIGRHGKYANLVFAGGHAMIGMSAAAGTGKLVEELIRNEPTSIPLGAFSPERFR